MMRSALLTLLVLLLAPGLAAAQALRSLIVPGDSVVAVAPRGQALPPPPTPQIVAPRPLAMAPAAAVPLAPVAAVPLAPAIGLLLPLAAAALLGGALPGSGGGTSAPSTTR